ncbi:TetR/AcrR family transcriptional regulator [Streptosporangium sp. NPDC048047]|uniref:TetR/AcrR family transcriptional regulator n=1 Tax=Streptosporangium sp. NPDC048047 TaxID=3155748 RepID=UPI0034272CBB
MKSERALVVAEAAITLLAERGMRGLTHRAVDEEAGLPPGSTSNLARTRSALLELALERLAEIEGAVFEPLLGTTERAATGVEPVAPGPGPGTAGHAPPGGHAAPGPEHAPPGGHIAPGPVPDRGPDSEPESGHEESLGPVTPGALAEMTAQALWAQLTVDRRRTVARYELALEATRRPELRRIYDAAGARFRTLAVAVLTAAGSPDPVRHGRQMVAYGEGVIFDAIAGAGAEPTLDDLRLGVGEVLAGMLGSAPADAEFTRP